MFRILQLFKPFKRKAIIGRLNHQKTNGTNVIAKTDTFLAHARTVVCQHE